MFSGIVMVTSFEVTLEICEVKIAPLLPVNRKTSDATGALALFTVSVTDSFGDVSNVPGNVISRSKVSSTVLAESFLHETTNNKEIAKTLIIRRFMLLCGLIVISVC